MISDIAAGGKYPEVTFDQMTGKSLHTGKPPSSELEEIEKALAPLMAAPQATAIFLDLDGTLAPIVSRPEAVAVPAPISKLVRALSRIYLAVTVVSGRPATEAKRILGISEMAYIGNHGLETMLPGRAVVVSEEVQPYLPRIRELVDFCRSLEEALEAGVWVEDKTTTMSLHYRRAPDPREAKRFIDDRIMPKVRQLELAPNEGRRVIEIKPPVDINKGVAVGKLLDLLEAKQAIYIGDDTTDIDALKELRKRKRRKNVVMVGVGVISDEMPADLPKYADLLVKRSSGVEMLLQLLAGEEL
ncbi:MAG: trehalose-phosphatase [Thermoleophilia bacterium]|nr:trehalose-phosphatase [Thermoleophilia bacterium]